ncbi:cmk-1 [Symbiodinium sp. CCMP2592]|nr:cmk-1 [Symbiodinium sp. CCMP2592]
MANSLLELFSMDAESAEPASETRSRDPLALQLVENRLTLVAEVAIEGAEVQVLGEEGGNEWPGLCANARCQLLQLTVDNRQGSAPTINLFGKELEVDISARNHRLGLWEPVLPRCGLRFSYHTQRKPDGGPRDVVVRADVSALKPVELVISVDLRVTELPPSGSSSPSEFAKVPHLYTWRAEFSKRAGDSAASVCLVSSTGIGRGKSVLGNEVSRKCSMGTYWLVLASDHLRLLPPLL